MSQNNCRKIGSWLLLLILPLQSGPASGVTIYRFGGAGLPLPPEAAYPDVVFRQLDWGKLQASAGGENQRIQIDDQGIGPLQYALQENVAPAAQQVDYSFRPLFDRNQRTFWTAESYLCGKLLTLPCSGRYGYPGIIHIDLDDELLLDRIELVSGGTAPASVVENVGVSLFPSRPEDDRLPRLPFDVEIQGNQQSTLHIPLPADQRTASLQLVLSEHPGPWAIAEILVYARGVAEQASYTANILDAGQPVVWGALRWSLLRQEPGSRVYLQTRGGLEADIFRYWRYTGIGDQKIEVSKAAYAQLRTSEKAPPTYNYDSWNPWTPRFDLADTLGAIPLSPSLRRAFQFQLEFRSTGEAGTQLEFLEVRASDPLVSEVVGELAPIKVQAGRLTSFTYTLKPRLQDGDPGFDRLEIRSTAARLAAVQAVRIDGFAVPFQVEALQDRRFAVEFPRVERLDSDALVEVVFQAQVLRYGGAFAASIADSRRLYEVPQPVRAGNVSDAVDGDRVWIETSIGVESVLAAQAVPAIFTPNGDQVNDQTRIVYDLFETTSAVPVAVEIRDLAGRPVRLLYAGETVIGHYQQSWDGRDERGSPVLPGLYIFRATAGERQNQSVAMGVVQVVY